VTYLVEVPLRSGDVIAVEVDDQDAGIVRAARPGEVIATATSSFEAALERLQPMAQTLVDKLGNLAERPDEMGIEFGMKLNVDAGLVIARTSGEANFKVTLQWRRR
jgi:Trypsin-co-occurring domain 1